MKEYRSIPLHETDIPRTDVFSVGGAIRFYMFENVL